MSNSQPAREMDREMDGAKEGGRETGCLCKCECPSGKHQRLAALHTSSFWPRARPSRKSDGQSLGFLRGHQALGRHLNCAWTVPRPGQFKGHCDP